MMSFIKKFSFAPAAFLALNSVALALTDVQPLPTGPTTTGQLLAIVDKVLNIVFTAMIILATFFVLMAGIKYITSQGSKEKTDEANKQILYAAIGIGIALLAKGLGAIVCTLGGAQCG